MEVGGSRGIRRARNYHQWLVAKLGRRFHRHALLLRHFANRKRIARETF